MSENKKKRKWHNNLTTGKVLLGSGIVGSALLGAGALALSRGKGGNKIPRQQASNPISMGSLSNKDKQELLRTKRALDNLADRNNQATKARIEQLRNMSK